MAVSLLYEFIAFEIKTKFSLSPSNSRKRESWDETARLDGVQKVGGIIIFFRRLWGNIHTLLTLTHIHRVHNLLFYSFKYNFVLSAIHTAWDKRPLIFVYFSERRERIWELSMICWILKKWENFNNIAVLCPALTRTQKPVKLFWGELKFF